MCYWAARGSSRPLLECFVLKFEATKPKILKVFNFTQLVNLKPQVPFEPVVGLLQEIVLCVQGTSTGSLYWALFPAFVLGFVLCRK